MRGRFITLDKGRPYSTTSGKYSKILAGLAGLSHAKLLKFIIFYLVNWSVVLSKRTQKKKQINNYNKPIKGQELSK